MRPDSSGQMLVLDAEEHYRLALHASSAGDHYACLMHLRRVLRARPRDPWALYLRATQFAELGLTERAIDGIEAALLIEPRIEIARCQLGVLLLQANRPAEAKQHLAALGDSSDHALRVFCDAVVALADNDWRSAREKLAENLSQVSRRSPFRPLMVRLLRDLAAR